MLHDARPSIARLRAAFAPLAEELRAALWPPACSLCGARAAGDGEAGHAEEGDAEERAADLARASSLCARHELRLDLVRPRCDRCAAPLAPSLPDGARCADCRRAPPAVRRTLALGDYRDEALRTWLLALKHRGRRDLARPLGSALGALLAARDATPPARAPARLVPVPLHPWRRLERGHDQALALARAAAAASGRPLLRALARRRWSVPQGEPGCVSRAANVRGAFRLRRGARRAVAGATVWLVDDVATSGATLSECARVLRRGGARWVGALVVARAGAGRDSGAKPVE